MRVLRRMERHRRRRAGLEDRAAEEGLGTESGEAGDREGAGGFSEGGDSGAGAGEVVNVRADPG